VKHQSIALRAVEQRTLAALWRNVYDKNNEVILLVSQIAAEVRVSERATRAALRDLERFGLITKRRNNGPFPNTYRLLSQSR
jgi:DNA-binding MarR family transcriptional regulator